MFTSHSQTLPGISIHSLRMEGDLRVSEITDITGVFQSTPSVWRETHCLHKACMPQIFQSTPSVWRETMFSGSCTQSATFQSTPSVWRETGYLRFS